MDMKETRTVCQIWTIGHWVTYVAKTKYHIETGDNFFAWTELLYIWPFDSKVSNENWFWALFKKNLQTFVKLFRLYDIDVGNVKVHTFGSFAKAGMASLDPIIS